MIKKEYYNQNLVNASIKDLEGKIIVNIKHQKNFELTEDGLPSKDVIIFETSDGQIYIMTDHKKLCKYCGSNDIEKNAYADVYCKNCLRLYGDFSIDQITLHNDNVMKDIEPRHINFEPYNANVFKVLKGTPITLATFEPPACDGYVYKNTYLLKTTKGYVSIFWNVSYFGESGHGSVDIMKVLNKCSISVKRGKKYFGSEYDEEKESFYGENRFS